MITSRVRGPCTPSTRFSSISLVALGPLIMVSGRVASNRVNACGTSATIWSRKNHTEVVVGNERDHPATLPR